MAAVARGSRRKPGQYTVPEVARQLGISERAVRLRIETGALSAVRDGRQWWVTLPGSAGAVVGGSGSGSPSGSQSGSARGSGAEPLEATYRVTPAEVERVIERTGAKYITDMQTLFDRVGQLYEARLTEQAATVVAKDETIAAQRDALAELRRRAEAAEAAHLAAERERDELCARLATVVDTPVEAAPAATEAPTIVVVEADTPQRPRGLWGRLWRAIRGS